MKTELIDIIAVGNILGEGVTWDPRLGCVLWTDIQAKKLHRLHLNSKKHSCYNLPDRLGAFGLTEDEDILICAFSFGFALYNYRTQKLSNKIEVEAQHPSTRMNDGRLDPQGRFWAGSMIENNDVGPPKGASLYSIEAGIVKKHISNIRISNGLAWSVNGEHMFFADTPTQKIVRYGFNQNDGSISNESIFAHLPEGAYPDGATTDSTNSLWCALWGSGGVIRYDSQGEVSHELKLPASQPTCVTFGGDDMDIIFVTTAKVGLAKQELAKQPEAGNLFIFKSDVKGVNRDHYYKIKRAQ